MSRAPFQVLVFPYLILSDGSVRFAVFRRNEKTGGFWQAIAGGGEDKETPLEAARREAEEEAGISQDQRFLALQSMCTIPVINISGFRWGPDVMVVPEHAFGVQVEDRPLTLSHEHEEYKWVTYEEARDLLQWDSNKNALWELHHRINVRREF